MSIDPHGCLFYGSSGDYSTTRRESGRGWYGNAADVPGKLNFESNRNDFLWAVSRVLSFDAGMSAGTAEGTEDGSWFVEADSVSVTALARRRSRARLEDERAKSARVVIVSSLFFVIIAAALLIGGHAAIDPLLESAMAARQSQGLGEVVYTMPDGIFCRHMSFDNATAQVSGGTLERCSNDGAGQHLRSSQGFSWRGN